MTSPKDILNSTTPEIRKIIEKVLQIEKEYEHIQNLEKNKSLEKEIADQIMKVIDKEIKQ